MVKNWRQLFTDDRNIRASLHLVLNSLLPVNKAKEPSLPCSCKNNEFETGKFVSNLDICVRDVFIK